MALRDIKNIHLYLVIFSHFRRWSVRKSSFVNIFGSVQNISRLHSLSKFQMLTIFRGRYIGGPSSIILRGTFRRISQLWDNAHTLNLKNCLFYLSSIISQFLDVLLCMVFYFIFNCVTMHTITRRKKRRPHKERAGSTSVWHSLSPWLRVTSST